MTRHCFTAKLGGLNYKVMRAELGEDAAGLSDFNTGEIWICETVPLRLCHRIYLHEGVHQALQVTGVEPEIPKALHEPVAEAIAHGLSQWLEPVVTWKHHKFKGKK